MNKKPCKPQRCRFETLDRRLLLSGTGEFRLRSTSLSQARYEMASTGVGSYALFAGGDINSAQVDILNVSTGEINTHSLSAGRPAPAAVHVGDLALFAGGGNTAEFSDSAAVDIFNADSGQWSVSRLSAPRGYLAGAAVGSLAMFAGGVHISGSFPNPVTTPTDVVNIYNANSNQWSIAHLSSARWNIAAVNVGDLILFAGGDTSGGVSNVVDIYDSASGTWSTMSMPTAAVFSSAVAVGTKVIFATDRLGGPDKLYEMYDAVTGRWTTGKINDVWGATSVGDNALFAEDDPNLAAGRQVIDVFNLATGAWSKTSLSNNRSEVSASSDGRFAFFAGGVNATGGTDSDVLDSLQDLDRSAALSGNVRGRAGGEATVLVENTGDAALNGPYSVQVYAYPPGERHRGILLGSSNVTNSLVAGSSTEISVSISVPSGSTAGYYHLVAMVKAANGTLIPFASATQNFKIKSPASAKPAADKSAPAVVKPTFSTTQLSAASATDPWLADMANVLE